MDIFYSMSCEEFKHLCVVSVFLIYLFVMSVYSHAVKMYICINILSHYIGFSLVSICINLYVNGITSSSYIATKQFKKCKCDPFEWKPVYCSVHLAFQQEFILKEGREGIQLQQSGQTHCVKWWPNDL